jgi:hypothetical protein
MNDTMLEITMDEQRPQRSFTANFLEMARNQESFLGSSRVMGDVILTQERDFPSCAYDDFGCQHNDPDIEHSIFDILVPGLGIDIRLTIFASSFGEHRWSMWAIPCCTYPMKDALYFWGNVRRGLRVHYPGIVNPINCLPYQKHSLHQDIYSPYEQTWNPVYDLPGFTFDDETDILLNEFLRDVQERGWFWIPRSLQRAWAANGVHYEIEE